MLFLYNFHPSVFLHLRGKPHQDVKTNWIFLLHNSLVQVFKNMRPKFQSEIRNFRFYESNTNRPSGRRLGANFLILCRLIWIYEDLSRDEILERCLRGHMQNANESFSSTVWQFSPKHLQSGLKVIVVGSYVSVDLFNEENLYILMIMTRYAL